jgi:hypothetical protein
MKCEEAQMRMAELLAGEIPAGEREALWRHLLDCAACRADFEQAKSGWRVEWPDAPVPAALAERTRAALRGEPALLKFFRFAASAAAALIVALLVAGTRVERPAPPPPRPPAPVAACVQDAVVGTMVAKDEEGRPVGELGLKSHRVAVEILDGIAKTTVEENFQNHTGRRLEGTFHFPLPPDASISRLALEVNGKIEEGTVVERERAREVFETIVKKMQDPALLEWQPGGLFKCRVFPIEPHATKRVIVAYTQALPFFRGKMSYVYPLASEKTRTHPPEELRIDLRARFSGRLSRIEAPSHPADVRRRNEHEAEVAFAASNHRPERDFAVTLETDDDELRAVTHRPEGEEGYFALFVTPRGAPARRAGKYVFVLDISATVSVPELEVSKRLVRAMMEKAIPGDRFEVLAHHVEVESSGEVDLRRANDFMDRLRPVGACDLLKALRSAPEGEIVYIGEGTPTYGETDAARILEAVKGRRIRTIGVGSDANVDLLSRLGGHFRVSPSDDVAKRAAEIAATLGSPALSGLRVEGGEDVVGVRDIFWGERLVVAGRFRGPAKLVVSGEGYRREIDVAFPAKEEANHYVRRLWAQRKAADLVAQGKKQEVVELGVKHQIMTPYTSLLVLESEQMWKDYQLKREVQKEDQVLSGRYAPERPELEKIVLDGLRKSEGMDEPGRRAELEALQRLVSDQRDDRLRKLQDLVESRSQQKVYQEVPTPAPAPAEVEKRLAEYKAALNREAVRPDAPARKVDPAPPDESFGDRVRQLLAEATELYKRGDYIGASSRFERAFQMQPSSDQVYAYIRRAGDEMVARMMNDPDRKMQDVGRRIFELAKPGHYMRSGRAVLAQYLAELKHEDHAIWRNSFWNLKNIGPYAAKDLIPALGDRTQDRYRSRVIMLLTEMGVDAAPAVMEALQSRDPFVRQNAAIVLGNVKDERALPLLARLVEDPNELPEVKKFAREAIQKTDRRAGAAPSGSETDPRAKAIRDQLEEPIRRERQQMTIKTRNASVSQIVEEFRRQTGWTIVVDSDARVDEFIVENETPRRALDAFAEKSGLLVQETGPNQFRLAARPVPPPPPKGPEPAPAPPTVVAPPPVPAPVVPDPPPPASPDPADLLSRLDEHRSKLAKALSEKSLLAAEVGYAREMSKRLERDLEELEEKHVELARDRNQLAERVRRLERLGAESETFALPLRNASSEDLARDLERLLRGSNPANAPTDPNLRFHSRGDRGGKWVGDLPLRTREGMVAGEKDGDFPAEYRELLSEYFQRLSVAEDGSLSTAGRVGPRQTNNDLAIEAGPDLRSFDKHDGSGLELYDSIEDFSRSTLRGDAEALMRRSESQLRAQIDLLEGKHVEMAREKKHLEERLNHLSGLGIRTDIAPRKPLSGKVTAIANELGLVVISVGKDAGALENDEFAVYRGGDFVAKIVIDRADRAWSCGRVVLKKSDPRVSDDASNTIFVSRPAFACRVAAAEGESVALDAGSKNGLARGDAVAISRDSGFVALVLILEVSENAARGRVWRGIATRRILAGDQAERVGDMGTYLAGLPAEVKAELASRANLLAIRAKMGLPE